MLGMILLTILLGVGSALPRHALGPVAECGVQVKKTDPPLCLNLKISNQRGGGSALGREEGASIREASRQINTMSIEKNEKSAADWWLLVPTWLLALFTLGLFLYTAKLWAATSNLVKDAAENAQRQLRAYVFEELVVLSSEVPNGYTPSFELTVKNSGNTPAENVIICIARVLAAATNPVLPPLRRTDRGSVF